MRKKTKKWTLVKELFSGWAVLFHLTFYFAVNGAFLNILTNNTWLSVVVAIPAAFLFFYVFSLIHKKIEKRRLTIQEIGKYTTSLTFYLNAGQNVPDALKSTLSLVDSGLKKDIQKTLDILTKKAQLDTTHFQKYHLSSLDLFHQTLLIKYEKGGHAKEMFMKPFQGVQFEIGQIDDLIRQKSSKAQQIYVMQLFAASITGAMAFLPGGIYEKFLTLPSSVFVVMGFYVFLLYNIYQLQRDKTDISLRI